ncbi:hypothetical protein RHGRI_021284 [Rhododendron griersonianum]|uniref:Uncharacterized protein n=1 Tax=Rhododendron griersonianum TaxID=479676 RepID=A0AAV6JPZ2_9ERIC|nr:hypothetical protein RHGRI_021284 [Rhododendron griersonianum]
MNPDRLEEHDEELLMTNPPPTTIVEYRKALRRRDMYIAKQKVMLASLRKKSMRLRCTKELHKLNIVQSSLIDMIMDLENRTEGLRASPNSSKASKC